jgi:hypothetical protein
MHPNRALKYFHKIFTEIFDNVSFEQLMVIGPHINSASKVLVWTRSKDNPDHKTEKDPCRTSRAHEIEIVRYHD